MKIRTLFLLIVLAAISVFVALNWGAFKAPTALSLAVGTIEAPLGLVMLGLAVFLTALFVVFAVFIRTSALLDTRRHEHELQAMRELAEDAEASRFTKLREILEKECQRVADMVKESRAEMAAGLDRLESALGAKIDQSGNSLAAYIGELDDKLEKGAPDPSP